MIILTIGDTSRRITSPLGVAEADWVLQHMRATAGAEVPRVHVRIDAPSVALNLSAGEAVEMRGRLRGDEAAVMSLWHQRGLDRADYRAGQLVAFLHQLSDYIDRQAELWDADVTVDGRGSIFNPDAPVAQVDRAQVS